MNKLLILAILVLSACTDQRGAQNALDDMGMKNIVTGGYDWFSCSKDDFYHTHFTADNANGKQVSGTVCSGIWFKNSTVRFSR